MIVVGIRLVSDRLYLLDSNLFPSLTLESISLNLHLRVKIEDESHGCSAKFSSAESQLSPGVFQYPESGCEYVLFASLSLSPQDSLVNTDEQTVSPKPHIA